MAGYDDRYQDAALLPNVRPDVHVAPSGYERTNRAVFAKIQYLFRR
jgi:hypothetical protein